MFYVNSIDNYAPFQRIGIIDTDDWIEEFYQLEDIWKIVEQTGIKIKGVDLGSKRVKMYTPEYINSYLVKYVLVGKLSQSLLDNGVARVPYRLNDYFWTLDLTTEVKREKLDILKGVELVKNYMYSQYVKSVRLPKSIQIL